MTKFAFEVPHAHLEDFEDLQDFHFALSIFCKIPSYRNFYLKQSIKGTKQVWLDNSFNERGKADDITNLVSAVYQIEAHKVIAPDSPKWAANQIVEGFKNTALYISTSKIIVVIKDSMMMHKLASYGAMNFAISYHVRRARDWVDFFEVRDCHFLGLVSVKEIINLKPPSCDTSRPIKLALQGKTLRKWSEKGCLTTYHPPGQGKRPYFNIKMTTKQIDLARANIIALKEATR